MKREKEELIQELLSDDVRRSDTLAAGGRILRRRRQWRVASQTLAILVVATAGLWLATQKPEQTAQAPVLTVKAPATETATALTDEELLALFPNTPVGLAKLPSGKKILIFPRPGDEQRFITRL